MHQNIVAMVLLKLAYAIFLDSKWKANLQWFLARWMHWKFEDVANDAEIWRLARKVIFQYLQSIKAHAGPIVFSVALKMIIYTVHNVNKVPYTCKDHLFGYSISYMLLAVSCSNFFSGICNVLRHAYSYFMRGTYNGGHPTDWVSVAQIAD